MRFYKLKKIKQTIIRMILMSLLLTETSWMPMNEGFAATKDSKFGGADFDAMYFYSGNDLGNTYTKTKTSFRVWAPSATAVKLITYKKWDDQTGKEVDMNKSKKGTWISELMGDMNGVFYTYKVKVQGQWTEAADPYARSLSANGDKGAIIDLKATDPKGWKGDTKPKFEKLNDAIIYETHVRDFSSDPDSGIKNKGKFLAFTEKGTRSAEDSKTGIDYLKTLGITHLELLPIYDFASIDETSTTPTYNWGYDPKNYNAPEGSYSTDPYNPITRVMELKEAVQALHNSDIRVIMDVVFNHMFSEDSSNFNKIVPGYFFRYDQDGVLVNDSECGNTLATENSMVRKFIVDSVTYWAKEYNLDGYRFDLMGLIDTVTMQEVRKSLSEIDPTIVVLGEGWDMSSTLSGDDKSVQKNAELLPKVSFFNDTIRDGIKGSVFIDSESGFVNGSINSDAKVKSGIVGAIDYSSTINTWGTVEPVQSINYVEAHDNNTLWDKLLLTNEKDSDETRVKMDKIANSIIFTSQGIPFFQAGQEFLRTKVGDSNSYNSGDEVNMLDWKLKEKNSYMVDYVAGLIKLRKNHPAFRMESADKIKKNLKFIDTETGVIAYTLENNANGDKWSNIAVAFNANKEKATIKLPKKGLWNIVVNGEKSGVKTIKSINGDKVEVPAESTIILYSADKSNPILYVLGVMAAALLVICGIVFRKKIIKRGVN